MKAIIRSAATIFMVIVIALYGWIPAHAEETLTPDGNLSLVDDFWTFSDDGYLGKQFITVQSRDGTYYYIVIDRAGNTENVYFLNLVDDTDLLALMKKEVMETLPQKHTCSCTERCYIGHVDTTCPACIVDMAECKGTRTERTGETASYTSVSTETTEPKQGAVADTVLIVAMLIAVGGLAAYILLKIKKKGQKQSMAGLDSSEAIQDEDEYLIDEDTYEEDGSEEPEDNE